ncbi:MAG: sigma-70 family RNA polymerase sigma factor [Actinomycetota bacterium]
MDESAFEAWYRSEHRKVVASLVALTGDPDAAREANDEAFARALARVGGLDLSQNATGWPHRVALNCFRRTSRRRGLERRSQARAGRPDLAVPEPDKEIWDAVRRLPRRQREAVALRYVADLPEAEIALAMGISRGAVSSSLAVAKKALSVALSEPVLYGGRP